MSRAIIPVILSGGAGTRLWPLSTAASPKQFHALAGGEGTLLQQTALRVRGEDFAAPVVIAGAAHADLVERQVAEAALVILEPCPRNTAPAIALAALTAELDDLLLVMPSDHQVAEPDAFRAAIAAARPFAEAGWLVTFGIRPDRPETGYGYIAAGEAIGDGVLAAEAFVEKPDATTAQGFVEGGRHYWNGGIFLFRNGAFLAEMQRHAAPILDRVIEAMDEGRREGSRFFPDAARFAASPSQSIDYAVMEKAERIAVVPVAMGWSDVGSWDALYDAAGRDRAGNATAGEVVAIDSKGCLIRSDGPAVVTVGIEDLIVVASRDAVLVVPRGESQRAREAVDALAAARQKKGGGAGEGES
jgi:mannose-1-phosphate guanylyltransferase